MRVFRHTCMAVAFLLLPMSVSRAESPAIVNLSALSAIVDAATQLAAQRGVPFDGQVVIDEAIRSGVTQCLSTFDLCLAAALSHAADAVTLTALELAGRERFSCPDNLTGFVVVAEHDAGNYRLQLIGDPTYPTYTPRAILERLSDGATWCFGPDVGGGVVRMGTSDMPGPADYTGNGVLNILVQVSGNSSGCDHRVYVLELADEPLLIFRNESSNWDSETASGLTDAVCPISSVIDLDSDGRYELVSRESLWGAGGSNHLAEHVQRLEFPEDFTVGCPHSLTPYPLVVLTYMDGIGYVPVDPYSDEPLIEPYRLAPAYYEDFGWLMYDHLLQRLDQTELSVNGYRCRIVGPVLNLAYQGRLDMARALFDQLYVLDDDDYMWEYIMRYVRASPYVGATLRE